MPSSRSSTNRPWSWRHCGQKAGHKGHGRATWPEEAADRVERVALDEETCPDCGEKLVSAGLQARTVSDLRPLVVARKVSFGSQSQAGARTRETLMTLLHTLKKRRVPPAAAIQSALDRLVLDPSLHPF